MKIGYLGPTGTHSHAATKKLKRLLREQGKQAQKRSITLFPMASFTQLLMDVEHQALELACVPIENSIEGAVNEVIDNLALHLNHCQIVGDVVLPIQHALIRVVGALEGIQFIHSHPVALNQCRGRLYELLGYDITFVTATSTAEAVKTLLNSDESHAALATKEVADHYGLDIVIPDCSEYLQNATRFLLIAHHDHNPLKELNTSDLPRKSTYCLAFKEDAPGVLMRGLSVLAEANLNMIKIESRPTKQELGKYMFSIDIEGDVPAEVEAALKAQCTFFKCLGNYPVLGVMP